MVNFDQNLTQIVFLDCEFLVPEQDRSFIGASLNANPFKQGHKLLGGVFGRCFPLKGERSPSKLEHFWEWRDGSELRTYNRILSFFEESWAMMKGKDARQADLITVGIGIGRFDIPMLLSKGLSLRAREEWQVYELLCKTKIIDLDQVTIPYFQRLNERVLYPKFANLIADRFRIVQRKDPSQRVWDLYSSNSFQVIERRTESEVNFVVDLYNRIVEEIFGQQSAATRKN